MNSKALYTAALGLMLASPLAGQTRRQAEAAQTCLAARSQYSALTTIAEQNAFLRSGGLAVCEPGIHYAIIPIDTALTNPLRRDTDSIVANNGNTFVVQMRRRLQATSTAVPEPGVIYSRTTIAITTESPHAITPVPEGYATLAVSCHGHCEQMLVRLKRELVSYVERQGVRADVLDQTLDQLIGRATHKTP